MTRVVLDTLRDLAVRACSHRILGWGCDRIYDGAFLVTTAQLRREAGVRAVLLRHSDHGRDWKPGLSDFDLTVLMDEAPSTETLAFLERFWTRHARIKRMIPMLGEVDVLTPHDFVDYLTLGPGPTASTKVHALVFERLEPAQTLLVQNALGQQGAAITESDVLRDALIRYLRVAVPYALRWVSRPTPIHEALLVHVLSNVDRRLRRVQGQRARGANAGSGHLGDPFGYFVTLFRILSEQCRLQRKVPGRAVTLQMPSGRTGDLDRPWREVGPDLRSLLAIDCSARASVVLWWSFMLDRPALSVVIEDTVSDTDLVRILQGLARIHQASCWSEFRNDPVDAQFPAFSYPVLVSRSIWSAWLRLLPFDGAAVVARGRVVIGSDSVIDGALATVREFRRAAAVHYAALLSLRNNWRTLIPASRPVLYRTAQDFLRGYRCASTGDPVCTAPEPCLPAATSLEETYEELSRELAEFRRSLVNSMIPPTAARSSGGPASIQLPCKP